jgi:hypothetical protein
VPPPTTPEEVDEPIGRDDAAGLQEQEGKNGALLGPTELELLVLVPDFSWTEDPKLEHAPFLAPSNALGNQDEPSNRAGLAARRPLQAAVHDGGSSSVAWVSHAWLT